VQVRVRTVEELTGKVMVEVSSVEVNVDEEQEKKSLWKQLWGKGTV